MNIPLSNAVAANDAAQMQMQLQAQLYRYAEDMHQLMSEHDALQQRFRALDKAHRSVSEYRDLLSTLMHSASEVYVATDNRNRIVSCTQSANLFFGADQLVGDNLLDHLAKEYRAEVEGWLPSQAGQPDDAAVCHTQFMQADGQPAPAQIQVIACHATGEGAISRHWIIRPVAAQVQGTPDALSGENDYGSEGLFITDRAGHILTVNAAFVRITGYSAAEAIGQTLRRMKSAAQGERFHRLLWEQLQTVGNWQGEIMNRRKSGEIYPEWLSINCARDKHGNIVSYFAKFHDLSRLHESERQLSRLAYFDVLTGLPNRQLFNDRLHMAINQSHRENNKFALMFIDLDRFKQINDTLGHDVGDELLKIVAQRLSSVTREIDTVARLGGDEFTVILPGLLQERDAHTVANKILDIFQPPIQIGLNTLFAAPSIGIALFPDHGEDDSTLLRHADAAMYHAKGNGGNTYRLFEAEDDGDTRVLSLENAFRKALERGELYLVYQPQVSADGVRLLGIEALLRWRSPEFGDVSPEVFIPIAEWSGMIVDIGRWVLRNACRQVAEWQAAGLGVERVAVNISPRQLRDGNFSTMLLDELARSRLPGTALELEITESELMLYPESTMLKLAELRAYGISIAIDDFGTGYSNLARLRTLPVDRIKVDRSFVHNLEEDGNAQAISACIVTMARAMNLEVIAEGVETTGQLHCLLNQGCHSVQGYLFAQPMLPESFAEWISTVALNGKNQRC